MSDWDFSGEEWAFLSEQHGRTWVGSGGVHFDLTQTKGNRIGGGAFGAVFKARHEGHLVAAKSHHALLHPMDYGLDDPANLQGVLRELLQEIRMLATVQHENILKFVGVAYVVEQDHAINMPAWILTGIEERGSFHDWIRSGEPPSPEEIERVGLGLGSGLSYLHGRGMVHRDIKPKNILIGAGGKAVIADLGLAKLVQRLGTLTTGMATACGSPFYLGPEGGLSQQPARDVFASGCSLCEALLREDPKLDRRQEQIELAAAAAEAAGKIELAQGIVAAMDPIPDKRPPARALPYRYTNEERQAMHVEQMYTKQALAHSNAQRDYMGRDYMGNINVHGVPVPTFLLSQVVTFLLRHG